MNKQDALKNAIAIVKMEDYTISEEHIALIQKYLNNDINIIELINMIINNKVGDK